MTKAELVNEVYEKIGIPKREAAEIVESVFDIIKSTLASGETIKISRFGTFSVRKRKARKGRDFQSGEEILIGPKRVVTFKPSQKFKDIVNS
ncbi:MAG: integration host factor subunit alpha [Nitrospirae bacterium]|nr:MAG: integration host factor subunit alpha [Nitrospirota bacterium]